MEMTLLQKFKGQIFAQFCPLVHPKKLDHQKKTPIIWKSHEKFLYLQRQIKTKYYE